MLIEVISSSICGVLIGYIYSMLFFHRLKNFIKTTQNIDINDTKSKGQKKIKYRLLIKLFQSYLIGYIFLAFFIYFLITIAKINSIIFTTSLVGAFVYSIYQKKLGNV